MITLNERPDMFIDWVVRVYIVNDAYEPFRVSSLDLAEKYAFDHDTLMNLIWHRTRHIKGLLGNTVTVSKKSGNGRPRQERLLNIRQANDLLFDVLSVEKARNAMRDIRKSIMAAAKYPDKELVDPALEEKVRSRIIYYLANEKGRAGVSQNELARRMGISATMLSQWLKDGYPCDGTKKRRRIVDQACAMFPDLLQPDKPESEASAEDAEFSRSLDLAFGKMIN
jgi:hypothetical protein